MATLNELREQRDALVAIRNSGTSGATVDNQSVSFQSATELNNAINALDKQIANQECRAPRKPRYSTVNCATSWE